MSMWTTRRFLPIVIATGLLITTSSAFSQESLVLDPIVVLSPSPILSGSSGVGQGDDQLPGTLVVIDDAFVPVTVAIEREALSTQGGNIADVLDQKPGIIGSTYAPGANRPIIRGLDNYRVRIQENGISTHDVSALSEDHAVPIDPFTAEQIEVIRGPATLRYGSQAFGGVVAVENNRIPTYVPKGGFSAKLKGGLTSVDEGIDGGLAVTAGGSGFVVHADTFKRDSEDYDTPRGEQFNTFAEAEGFGIGGSLIGQDGFIGVSFSRYFSLYGLPGEEAAELMPRIDLEQERIMAKGEWRPNLSGVAAVRFWFAHSDYEHFEVVQEGGHEGEEGGEEEEHAEGESEEEIGAVFATDVYEFRAELEHSPFNTSFGRLSGALGIQYFNSDTSGISNEGQNLLEPAETDSFAAFIFEELEVSNNLTLQAASRIEHSEIDGEGRVDQMVPGNAAFNREFTPYSGSLGMLYRLPGGNVFSLTGQYVERAPADAELYSAGIHEATETFEIGDPNLSKEKAFTVEAGLRKKTGPLRYSATAYYTNFDGFIFKDLTGRVCDVESGICAFEDEEEGEEEGEGHGHEELNEVLFDQRDATFYGVEIAVQYDVAKLWKGVWGVDGQFDFVRAEFDDGEDVPRIPPARLGGGIFYRDQNLFARAGVLHAFKQDDIAPTEIETPGYTLVSAELSYTADNLSNGLGTQMTIGVKGENLLDDEILNHTSFKRSQDVYLPGANVRVFGSIKLN